MMPYRNRTQKVVASCIVYSGERVLLMRGSQLVDPASQEGTSYFNVPRFTVAFGDDPVSRAEAEISAHLAQQVGDLSVISVSTYFSDEATQVIDITFASSVTDVPEETVGRCVFAHPEELHKYVFPDELSKLRRLIDML